MSFASEFKEFAVKGNVMDLAVGVIIGAAFGKIVDSMVNDLIMPVVGKALGGLDFSNYFVPLSDGPPGGPQTETYAGMKAAAVPVFAYGNFITVAINFLILAFIIFLLVKMMNRMKRAAPPATPAAPPKKLCCCGRFATASPFASDAASPRWGWGRILLT